MWQLPSWQGGHTDAESRPAPPCDGTGWEHRKGNSAPWWAVSRMLPGSQLLPCESFSPSRGFPGFSVDL